MGVLVWVAVVWAGVTVMGGVAEEALLPAIPSSITLQSSSLFNLWTHALRSQQDENEQPLRSERQAPGTVLSPSEHIMVNLVPMDAPHPLYGDKELRTSFLQDYMIPETVHPDDPNLSQPDGLTVTNFNGNQLTFRKDGEGRLSVNGAKVTEANTLSDGVVSYTLDTLLFEHHAQVERAFQKLMEEESRNQPLSGPFGEPMEPEV